ncbi:MAG: hypothetical protein Q9227_008062 [Pyrenula ochraceoflavens]
MAGTLSSKKMEHDNYHSVNQASAKVTYESAVAKPFTATATEDGGSSTLVSLPLELHLEIFELLDWESVINFLVTNSYFASVLSTKQIMNIKNRIRSEYLENEEAEKRARSAHGGWQMLKSFFCWQCLRKLPRTHFGNGKIVSGIFSLGIEIHPTSKRLCAPCKLRQKLFYHPDDQIEGFRPLQARENGSQNEQSETIYHWYLCRGCRGDRLIVEEIQRDDENPYAAKSRLRPDLSILNCKIACPERQARAKRELARKKVGLAHWATEFQPALIEFRLQRVQDAVRREDVHLAFHLARHRPSSQSSKYFWMLESLEGLYQDITGFRAQVAKQRDSHESWKIEENLLRYQCEIKRMRLQVEYLQNELVSQRSNAE